MGMLTVPSVAARKPVLEKPESCAVFSFDSQGWLSGIECLPSPHFNERPSQDACPHVVVMHNISLPPQRFATGLVKDLFMGTLDVTQDETLSDLKGLRVSSHFFIERTGHIIQFVSCDKRAWHAGVSRFNGRDNCNDFSIGIELEGTDLEPFEDAQYHGLTALLSAIDAKYSLSHVVGHSDIAPGRKTDPGPHFDWVRLFRSRSAFGSPDFPGAAARMQLSILEQSFSRV